MLNPAISCGVYFFDLLIIYIFFSRISSKKSSAIKCLMIGLLLFEIGSLGNLLSQNNIWINTILSFGIRIAFGLLCFRFKKITAVCYSAVLVVLNLAMEIVAVLLISALTNSQAMDYNDNFALLLIEVSFCKLLFFITCLFICPVYISKFYISFYIYKFLSCCICCSFSLISY